MGFVTWSIAKFYDRVMHRTEKVCLGPLRRELLGSLTGRVLEIGAGTGVNIPHYPDGISGLTLGEPDQHMRRRLAEKLKKNGIAAELLDAPAESLPFDDNFFDAAVATLVLCSVISPEQSLRELYRVLKPGGKLALIEHVADPERGRTFRWQQRIEPLWKRCAGNCHLTRDTLATVAAADFDISRLRRGAMWTAPFFAAPLIIGLAKKP